jgi:hypothetical protein
MSLAEAFIQGYVEFFKLFLSLVFAPFKHPELLWVLLPIYVSWLLTETFHEFEREDVIFGANSCFWIAMEWGRQSFSYLSRGNNYAILGFVAALIMLIYGLILVYLFMKGKTDWLTRFLARNREIAFLQIVLTPLVYYPQEYISLLGKDLITASITMFLIFIGFIPLAHVFGELLKIVGKHFLLKNYPYA